MSDARSPDGLAWFDYETIEVPDDLGSMEFTPPPQIWQRFEKLPGKPESVFMTLALRPMTQLHTKYRFRPGESPINAGHEAEYFSRPLRVTYRGVVEKKVAEDDRTRLALKLWREKPAGQVGIGSASRLA